MQKEEKRKFSAGTKVVLTMTLVILAVTAFALIRLSSGAKMDLTRIRSAAVDSPAEDGKRTTPAAEIPPAAAQPQYAGTAAAQVPEDPQQEYQSVTLTLAGTVALDGELRKNSYYSDVKQYDYYDDLALLQKELRSDVNIVFLENVLTEDNKATDVKATAAAAAMLKAGGFQVAACGFARAFDLGEEGIRTTRKVLREHGIDARGIRESDGQDTVRITEVNGIRIAILQYTATVAAATRKNMVKQNLTGTVPPTDAETIAQEIKTAREQNCDAVIVLLNWGKTGKGPDKTQRALAQQIADAGADLIAGSGSRIVSGAEKLATADGRQVMCIWSLGTAMTGDRSNIKRIAGMLVHATIRKDRGRTAVLDFSYTPVYTWKYKMDGRFYYRCLAANGSVPDGMDSDQQKYMKKGLDAVRIAMKDAPMEERASE